jgi:hypothetical protein
MNRFRCGGFWLLACAMGAQAEERTVAIIFPETVEAYTDPDVKLFFAPMLENHFNKKSAAQVKQFRADLNDEGFDERAARVLACIGAAAVTDACPKAIVIKGQTPQAMAQLKATDARRMLIIRLLPLRTDERIRLRAVATDQEKTGEGFRLLRTFTAVYQTRTPAALEKSAKGDTAKLAAWWAEGSPPRLASEVDQGLEELRQMLGMLEREVRLDGETPAGWAELPKMKELEKAGRIKCGGMTCGVQRVAKDLGARVWLLSIVPQGPIYGWSIASLDDSSSRYANLMLPIQTMDQ